MELIKRLSDKVVEGSIDEVKELTQKAIQQKVEPQQIMNNGFMLGLEVVGEKYSAGEIFLPEMLVSGMAVAEGMKLLKPLIVKSSLKSKGTVVAGTVTGDIHDIGKNIVCMMLEGAGFKVIDLGTDLPADRFIKSAIENKADIIAMSALLSTTRGSMKGIIEMIRASELGNKVKVMVGGAPVTQEFADTIGADGYAPDAGLATKKAIQLLNQK